MPDVLRGPGEIAEDEAIGAVADAYARLRAALGVPFLPTVVRMLGGYDRLLTAATDAIEDVIGGPQGEAFAAAARARGTQAARRLPGGALDAGGDAAGVSALLDRYNVANPRNLLLVLALGAGAADAAPEHAVMRAPLPPATGDLLEDVRACHGGYTVPGMWRELAAGWPGVAADAWRLVRPLAAEEELHAAIADVSARGRELVAGLAMPDPAELGYDAGERAAIAGILAWFRIGIPTMVVEIEYLRDRLDHG